MAQVRFGVCVDEFAKRPHLVPRFVGGFTARDPPRCYIGQEERRRKDVTPSQYGTGTPSIEAIAFDPWGVPEKYKGGYIGIETPEGMINLTVDSSEAYDPTFMPTVSMLNAVPYFDTRMRALSDRYYK